MNNLDEVIEVVETFWPSRELSPVERLVLRCSWLGQSYSDIADSAGYSRAHIKQIGSGLWNDLSKVVGQRITKKNLHLVLEQYWQQTITDYQSTAKQEFSTDKNKTQDVSSFLTQTQIQFPGDPLPTNSPLYINRPPIEELAATEISQPGCIIGIKAPGGMGKSSLLNQIIARAKHQGYKTVYLNLKEAEEAIFASLNKFLRWFCANVTRQLKLKPTLGDYWDEDMGSKVSCKIYFEAYLLEQIHTPIVLALDEVHRVFEHPSLARDFLGMLRFWHEMGQQLDTWQKLRILVVHATEIYIPLKLNQSPFNVGLSLKLSKFSLSQVQDLAVRYGLDGLDTRQAKQLMAMVGGHPYLLSVALYHLVNSPDSSLDNNLEKLLRAAPTQGGIYSDHLRGHLVMLRDNPQLSRALQEVISSDDSVQLEPIAAYKLESMGLIQLNGDRAKPSCQLYSLYFDRQLGL